MTMIIATVDRTAPETKVKSMNSDAPANPHGGVHFVLSNGVINLAADKARVFQEAARLLKRGGRLAIADVVTELPLPENVVCNADLWAACIGGAAQQEDYRTAIETAGLRIERIE